jgi:hypothetical protein
MTCMVTMEADGVPRDKTIGALDPCVSNFNPKPECHFRDFKPGHYPDSWSAASSGRLLRGKVKCHWNAVSMVFPSGGEAGADDEIRP